MKKILLDPGHGGIDPGAVSGGVRESVVVLAVAQKVQTLLKVVGRYEVSMTRESDEIVPLAGILRRVVAELPDAFVSIHANAAVAPTAQGFEVWVRSEFHQNSRRLAELMVARMWQATGQMKRGVKMARLHVLSQGTVRPALLVELGFLTHPEERARLVSEAFQTKQAYAIAGAVRDYFEGEGWGW